jgi:hypothetical protein
MEPMFSGATGTLTDPCPMLRAEGHGARRDCAIDRDQRAKIAVENEIATARPVLRGFAFVMAALCAATFGGCAGGGGGGFGLTRDASNEARRALDVDCIGALVFSPDGAYFAASNGRTLRVRECPSGRSHETLELRKDADGAGGAAIVFSPDGRWLAATCKDETAVKVFDTRDWSERALFLFAPEHVGAIAIASDGSEIAIGTSTSRIALCTIETGAQRVLRKSRAAATQDAAPITFVAYGTADRMLLATAGEDVLGIDRASGDALWSRPEERVLEVARDARRFITASTKSGIAQLLDTGASIESGEPNLLCTFHDPAGPGTAANAVFDPHDDWIGIAYLRHFLGANWQELEFFRVTPRPGAKPGASATDRPGASATDKSGASATEKSGGLAAESAGASATAKPAASANDRAGAPATETFEARPIRSLRAGEPRRITISVDGKLLCLCTLPIAAIYETNRLLSEAELRD